MIATTEETRILSVLSKEQIEFFMSEALSECNLAIERGEVPVGCVFLYIPSWKIISRGHNLTNKTKNATTHAEMNCFRALGNILKEEAKRKIFVDKYKIKHNDITTLTLKDIMKDTILFVSCEPCIMCAYALSIVNIQQVYFGCENEKFGGNGSILSVHKGPGLEYKSEGGYLSEEAIAIFKKFYERGNAKAPDHKRQRKL